VSAHRAWLVAVPVVVALAAVAGCSGNDNGGALSSAGPTVAATPVDVALVIDLVTGGDPATLHASITCQGASAIGTGFLIFPTAATEACTVLRSDTAVRARLTGPAPSQSCPAATTGAATGPKKAHVTGTLKGAPVDTTVDRSNPCDVASWDQMIAVLGPV
jgi:hypothetical protein